MTLPSPERLTVARELHDGLAQDLVGIGYALDLLLAHSSLDLESRRQIRQTRLNVDEVIAKVRAELLNLRSPKAISISKQVEGFAQSILSDIPCTLELEDIHLDVDASYEVIAIVKEILRNVRAHSRATHVAIKLYPVNNRICIEMSDNGIGGAHMKEGHFGFEGIIERVKSVQGGISIQNIDGTHVTLLV